jgi:hypothetical protein
MNGANLPQLVDHFSGGTPTGRCDRVDRGREASAQWDGQRSGHSFWVQPNLKSTRWVWTGSCGRFGGGARGAVQFASVNRG